jgi:hypothetical protein
MPFIRLSSRLTLAYKLLIPIMGLLGLIAYVWVMLAQNWLLEAHGVVAAFLFGLLLLFIFSISLRIKHVAYNHDFIRVRNYGAAVLIPADQFRRLEPVGFPLDVLSRLHTATGSSLFLMSYGDFLAKFF